MSRTHHRRPLRQHLADLHGHGKSPSYKDGELHGHTDGSGHRHRHQTGGAADATPAQRAHAHPGAGRLLLLVCVAQLIVILDITAVNVALPQLADGLHIDSSDIGWTVTSYSLIFGSLLLLGGRAADLIGRRRMFLTGLWIFSAASVASALAASSTGSFAAPGKASARRCSRPPPSRSSWPRSLEAMSAPAHWVPGAGVRIPMAFGFAVTAAGMLLLAGVEVGGGYLADVLPGMMVAGFGLGLILVSVSVSLMAGAPEQQTGMLSGLNTTGHEIGGTIGIAILVTVAMGVGGGGTGSATKLTLGISDAFLAAGAITGAASLIALLILPAAASFLPKLRLAPRVAVH